jgi:hypothetical protein
VQLVRPAPSWKKSGATLTTCPSMGYHVEGYGRCRYE